MMLFTQALLRALFIFIFILIYYLNVEIFYLRFVVEILKYIFTR